MKQFFHQNSHGPTIHDDVMVAPNEMPVCFIQLKNSDLQ
ncbi:hypothetical protein BAME_33790 [Bacillus sp. M 2-6]|nr:hypothetical protein BAME_33790 [Bacillus sp. M 2-6]KIL28619.1 hypothetical protein B4133_0443 [Bacillus altitudinis]PYH22658.1 hypothetical protein US8_02304 [Bacillus altitudinis]